MSAKQKSLSDLTRDDERLFLDAWNSATEGISIYNDLCRRHKWPEAEQTREIVMAKVEAALDILSRVHKRLALAGL